MNKSQDFSRYLSIDSYFTSGIIGEVYETNFTFKLKIVPYNRIVSGEITVFQKINESFEKFEVQQINGGLQELVIQKKHMKVIVLNGKISNAVFQANLLVDEDWNGKCDFNIGELSFENKRVKSIIAI